MKYCAKMLIAVVLLTTVLSPTICEIMEISSSSSSKNDTKPNATISPSFFPAPSSPLPRQTPHYSAPSSLLVFLPRQEPRQEPMQGSIYVPSTYGPPIYVSPTYVSPTPIIGIKFEGSCPENHRRHRDGTCREVV